MQKLKEFLDYLELNFPDSLKEDIFAKHHLLWLCQIQDEMNLDYLEDKFDIYNDGFYLYMFA
jgi:hypothetical protein